MTLSPAERKEVLEMVAEKIVENLIQSTDLDELATIDLATAGQFLGLGPTAAARALPVIEVGPRTRRVSVKAIKTLLAERTVKKSR